MTTLEQARAAVTELATAVTEQKAAIDDLQTQARIMRDRGHDRFSQSITAPILEGLVKNPPTPEEIEAFHTFTVEHVLPAQKILQTLESDLSKAREVYGTLRSEHEALNLDEITTATRTALKKARTDQFDLKKRMDALKTEIDAYPDTEAKLKAAAGRILESQATDLLAGQPIDESAATNAETAISEAVTLQAVRQAALKQLQTQHRAAYDLTTWHEKELRRLENLHQTRAAKALVAEFEAKVMAGHIQRWAVLEALRAKFVTS